jgi:hypothetical protein
MADEELAAQVRYNMDYGVKYLYFLYFSVDTIEKICQSLQVILAAGIAGADHPTDFSTRLSIVKNNKARILDDLRTIVG